MQLGMQPAQRPRDRPDRPRTAVEVCQEVAAPEALDDESRSPIEVDLSVKRGDRRPGGRRGGEHERLALDGGPLLAGETEPQHTGGVDREDLSFSTGRETFERLEPDLVLHRLASLVARGRAPASRRTASETRSADALGDVSSNGATMKVLEGLKAIEPGTAVPLAELGLPVTSTKGLLLVFWKST
jgi:hypothetical protein